VPRTTWRDLSLPRTAPAAPAWDAADLFLHSYFRRAMHGAVVGALITAGAGCADVHGGERDQQTANMAPSTGTGSPTLGGGTQPLDAGAPPSTQTPFSTGTQPLDPSEPVNFDPALVAIREIYGDAALVDPPHTGRSYWDILADDTASAVPADAGAERFAWKVPPCLDDTINPPLDTTVDHALDLSRLGLRVDYAALRITSALPSTTISGESGSVCATATDPVACNSKVATIGESLLPATAIRPCGVYCDVVRYVVTTQADEVKSWRTAQELSTLFGSVDSVSEAMAILFVQGVVLSCHRKFGAYHELPDGFEVRSWEVIGTCPPRQTGYVTRRVARDGGVQVTSEEVVSSAPNACPID
jgi:hypothetical protein